MSKKPRPSKRRKINRIMIYLRVVLVTLSLFFIINLTLIKLLPVFFQEEVKINYAELPETTMTIQDYTMYGTQLLLNYSEKQANWLELVNDEVYPNQVFEEYILYNEVVDGISFPFTLDNYNSQGIEFQDVAAGNYYLVQQVNEDTTHLVTTKINDTITFHTVRVNNMAKKVTINTSTDHIYITVADVSGDSFTDADIVIDAGHGNIKGSEQDGACTDYADLSFWSGACEREIMLDISLYLQERLEEHGLVVAMTRTGDYADYEPTGDFTNSQYKREDAQNSKADEISKTTSVLTSNAKLALSMHFNNIADDTYDDLDLYQSIFVPTKTPTNYFAEQLVDALSYTHVGDTYLLERDYCLSYNEMADEEHCEWGENDYYYMLREYGGAFTNALYYDNELIYGEHLTAPEAILVELFNGANPTEVANYENELRHPATNTNLETFVKTIVEYYGIVYDEMR